MTARNLPPQLAEAGAAATPALDFDAERGHQFIRFSFAGSAADIATAAAERPLECEITSGYSSTASTSPAGRTDRSLFGRLGFGLGGSR